ncbi:MAG: hypothetical protein EOO60_05425 [Hymenobacter sp.]|nr:MAG: hypothetical protein EOO60_05425 [Hymenobacter sp.]
MSTQVLQLTGIIKQGDSPGVFVGAIKEISGIVSQGDSVDEVYENLLEITRTMLEYKRPQALALLAAQTHSPEVVKTNAKLDFHLVTCS